MTIHNLKRLAGIHEGRNAEGDAVLLADSLLRSLKRCRQLSEHYMSKSLINDTKKLKRTLAEQQFGPELFRIKELAGFFESDDQDDDDSDSKDNSNSGDYGYETDKEGNERGSNPAVRTELAALHSDMMDCWSSLRKCIMDCTMDGTEVPSAMSTTVDKLGRAIEEMEQLAGKV